MPEPTYRLVTNEVEARAAFEKWRAALLEHAIRDGNLWRLPDQNFVFRGQGQIRSGKLGRRVALGLDSTGENWVLQINEGEEAGDANVLSAIAVDKTGCHFLVRQGRLQKNSISDAVYEEEFKKRTGLKKVLVEGGDTRSKKRDWYIVSALANRPAAIRNATAIFVDICAAARGSKVGPTLDELEILRQLYGADETGGAFLRAAKAAQPEKLIAKLHGDVFKALASLLRSKGVAVRKPCLGGYSVDAQITNKRRRLLVEIKTSSLAGDIHAGVGQLMLYRHMMAHLASHRPVLLLPKPPQRIIQKAVEDCGITICLFDYENKGAKPIISFSNDFLDLCGVRL